MGFLKDQVRARVATRAEMEALRREVRRLRRRLDQRSARLTRLRGRVQSLALRLRDNRVVLRQLQRVTATQTRHIALLRSDFERMAHQLAAAETRIEWLRERVDPEVFEGSTEERVEARQLVEEIRREHEQIRVRFQVVSNYEERLSRVEKSLAGR